MAESQVLATALTEPSQGAVSWLPLNRFAQLVTDAPLVALDLVCLRGTGTDQEVLLGLRNNSPAKGYWFVPGGRMHKGEQLDVALARTVQAELGLTTESLARVNARWHWLGVYQHFYADSFVSPDVSTHYVVLAHSLSLPPGAVLQELLADKFCQHSQWKWWPVTEALASPDVHVHTKDYLGPNMAVFGGGT